MSNQPSVESIEYHEFEIEVDQRRQEVRILSSQFDRPWEDFQPPYDLEQMSRQLERLDELILSVDSESVFTERRDLAASIGQNLYKSLFPGKIEGALDQNLASIEAAQELKNVGLRTRLSFGQAKDYVPEALGLPWELACSPEGLVFLFRSAATPLVRHLDLKRASKSIRVEPPLRVLAILASPRELPQIDIGRQEDVLRAACEQEGRMSVDFLNPPTLSNLRETLQRATSSGKPYHVLHFLGHGAFDSSGYGFLNFEDRNRGRERVEGRALASILSGFPLAFTVLSTCKGARMMRSQGQHPFTGVAAALVATGSPAVIGMQFPITERAAADFNHSFYRFIGQGRSLEEAVTEGRLRILGENSNNFEWASPVLFLRSRDGQVLSLSETHGEKNQRNPADATAEGRSSGPRINAGRDVTYAGRDVNNVGGNQYNS